MGKSPATPIFSLPMMAYDPEPKDKVSPGALNCPTCPIYKYNENAVAKLCEGGCCEGRSTPCDQQRCDSVCNGCGTSGNRSGSMYPSVCGHSPMRPAYAGIFQVPFEPYKRPPLHIKQMVIPEVTRQSGKYFREHKTAETEKHFTTWAVAYQQMFDGARPYSKDFKDYLGLPKDHKLMLQICSPDYILDQIWVKGERDFSKYGVDYWTCGEFSYYPNMSNFFLAVQAQKVLLHAARTQAHIYFPSYVQPIPRDFWDGMQDVKNIGITFYTAKANDPAVIRRKIRTIISLRKLLDGSDLFFFGTVGRSILFSSLDFARKHLKRVSWTTSEWFYSAISGGKSLGGPECGGVIVRGGAGDGWLAPHIRIPSLSRHETSVEEVVVHNLRVMAAIDREWAEHVIEEKPLS